MNHILKILLLISNFLISGTVCSQSFIEGKIIDAETKSPVAYANLSIIGSNHGTATDQNGNFNLKIETFIANEKIKISCIGYSSLVFPFDSLARLAGQEFIISLPAQPLVLKEVVVKAKPVSPMELLNETFKAIPLNYSQHPFNMEFYSSVTVCDSSKTYYQIESILLTYRKGYVPGGDNISKILQKREIGTSPIPPVQHKKREGGYFPYWPDFNISLIDRIGTGPATGWTIFNPSLFKKLKFRYAGISVFDQDTVCVIEYSTKGNDVKESSQAIDGKYNGIIYLAVNNLAIIRHTLKIGSQFHDIIYRRIGDKYFPYLIKGIHVYRQNEKDYSVVQEVFLRTTSMESVEVFERNADRLYYEDVPFNKEYWKANYPRQKLIP